MNGTEPEKFLTTQRICRALRELGVQEGDTVLAHTSLSATGWVCGGAQALAMGLLAAVGESGTLVFPTQTGENSEPSFWQRPAVPADWQQEIRETMPAFDPLRTPSRHMGQTAELLRSFPSALRSCHPMSSFGAIGPKAAGLLAKHELAHSLGEASPLGALYRDGAKLLFVGVGYENCTALHLAEERAGVLPLGVSGSAVLEGGKRVWKTYEEPDYSAEDFEALGADFEAHFPVRRSLLGMADVKLVEMPALVDFGTAWLKSHRAAGAARLVRLDVSMEKEYGAFLKEFEEANEPLIPAGAALLPGQSFSAFCKMRRSREQWAGCPEGLVPSTLYLLISGKGGILGAVDIRHELTEGLLQWGGHIGYGVRPSRRRQGYGQEMLRQALPLAKSLGLSRVLVTCRDENTASARVIEKNGGKFEDKRKNGEALYRRYWIEPAASSL